MAIDPKSRVDGWTLASASCDDILIWFRGTDIEGFSTL